MTWKREKEQRKEREKRSNFKTRPIFFTPIIGFIRLTRHGPSTYELFELLEFSFNWFCARKGFVTEIRGDDGVNWFSPSRRSVVEVNRVKIYIIILYARIFIYILRLTDWYFVNSIANQELSVAYNNAVKLSTRRCC